jgi:Multimeric flavodoxin WrbA
MPFARIAIVFHSGWGHTARLAEAVGTGVGEVEGAEALLMTVEEAQTRWDDLASADAIIFGSPTYMGNVSAAFKAFQEASSKAVMAKGFAWKTKLLPVSQIQALGPETSWPRWCKSRFSQPNTACTGSISICRRPTIPQKDLRTT